MRYLGVDWGLRKVGLAVSDGAIASPCTTLSIKNFESGIKQLLSKIRRSRVETVVVGKPEGEMGKLVERLVRVLRKQKVWVKEIDETLSSQKALREMIQSGWGKRRRRDDNAMSAAVILQNYLDELKQDEK